MSLPATQRWGGSGLSASCTSARASLAGSPGCWPLRLSQAAIVRSVNHKAGCHNCLPSYAGYEVPQPDQHPRDTHPPSMGSVCEYLHGGRGDFPAYVFMPCWLGWGQAFRRAGPYAGFLGKRYDPLLTECKPYGDKDGPPPAKKRRISKERRTEYLDLRADSIDPDQQPQLDHLLQVLHRHQKIVVVAGAGLARGIVVVAVRRRGR